MLTMGTNEESATAPTTNLKVPPLKIVLSSHQNNTIVTNSSLDETQSSEQSSFNSNETNDNSNDHNVEQKDAKRDDGGLDDKSHKDLIQKKMTKDSESYQISGLSSSSSSDRSNSTTPLSEPESVASNSTIISDQQAKIKSEDVKQDKNNKSNAKQINNNNNHKKTDGLELSNETTNNNTSKEQQNINANQRITRSSQRAQNKMESQNPDTSQGDEPNIDNIQDKLHESARKAKRKKGEVQEVIEQDSMNTTEQPAINFADIYPADYDLPSQNSFELYRDIRRRPYIKLSKLDTIRPKIPHGFKDYLINGGPYLLDGNKLGVGVIGARLRNLYKSDQEKNGVKVFSINRSPRKKLTNLHHKWSMYHPSQQRHNSYTVPKLLDAPNNLQVGSPLYELFLDQEKTRHQVKIQHLKERERSILTAEQEILRVYNKAAIAGVKQKLHLSACTYFYYQERYHYTDENNKKMKKPKESSDLPSLSNDEDNNKNESKTPMVDFLCAEGKEAIDIPLNQEVEKEVKEEKEEEIKDAFLAQLQEIDDKWAKIMKDMLTRHKNEADSLYAVQSLEWEWKAKEIGSCDVRISLKIESEMVPRIEIAPLDY